MNLLPNLVTVGKYGYITCDDGRDACFLCGITNLAHHGEVFAVNNGIYGEVRLHPALVTEFRNFAQVGNGELCGRVRTHVQTLNAEVYRVGTSFESRVKGFARTDGRHYFIVVHHRRL